MGTKTKFPGRWIILFLLVLALTGCSKTTETCPLPRSADLSGVLAYAEDEQAYFQFPLDELGSNNVSPPPAVFCTNGCRNPSDCEYHAAEDYHLPPGTPVYAMADGTISFSGPMGGYGWLIIIDHPEADLYSLYGHLSPSRWRLESGTVQKGDLIAYLGDPDENGGSPEQPLRPHLHFGVRVGQRNDYPGMGEWRWQAGWIKPCPANIGWLNPSEVITSQNMHIGELHQPAAGFVTRRGVEIIFSFLYVFGGIAMFVFAEKQKKPVLLLVEGAFFLLAWRVLMSKGLVLNYVLLTLAVLFIAVGIFKFIRGNTQKLQVEPQ